MWIYLCYTMYTTCIIDSVFMFRLLMSCALFKKEK